MRGLLVHLLTIALLAIGFAHHTPTVQDAKVESFVLSGGILADLCQDGTPLPSGAHADCPVCHLVSAAVLPATCKVARPTGHVIVARIDAPRASRIVAAVLDPSRASRAPPAA